MADAGHGLHAVACHGFGMFHNGVCAAPGHPFAAAEPIRSMLRARFKDSVVRAFLLEEDDDNVIELPVVHGAVMPDEAGP